MSLGVGFNFNTGSTALGAGTGGFGTGASGLGGSLFNQQATSSAAGAVTLPSASNPQSQEMLQVCFNFINLISVWFHFD